MIINCNTLEEFRRDFAKAVEELEEKYDVTLELEDITCDEDEFSGTLEVRNREASPKDNEDNGYATRDDLYELAFRFKETGLWEKMWDTEIFAIRLKSGDTGYVSIMGKNGEYVAVGLYIGDEGIRSYQRIAASTYDSDSEFKNREDMMQQCGLHLAFEAAEYLRPEEVKEVKAFAKKTKRKIKKKDLYPQFVKYQPNHYPWTIQSDEDIEALYEAVSAAIMMSDLLEHDSLDDLDIESVTEYTREIPLFEIKGSRLIHVGTAPFPEAEGEIFDLVIVDNDIAIQTMKKLPKKGIFESELIRMIEPMQDDPEDAPYYPLMLVMVDKKTQFLMHIGIVPEGETELIEILQEFVRACEEMGYAPKTIRCRDERTLALLNDMCMKSGIKICLYNGEMLALDEAEDAILNLMGEEWDDEDVLDDMMEMIDTIINMDAKSVRSMPDELVGEFKNLLNMGVLPDITAAKLKKKLKQAGKL